MFPRVGSLSREFLSRRKTHDGTVSKSRWYGPWDRLIVLEF